MQGVGGELADVAVLKGGVEDLHVTKWDIARHKVVTTYLVPADGLKAIDNDLIFGM